MRERRAQQILAGGVLALLLSAAGNAAAEPVIRTEPPVPRDRPVLELPADPVLRVLHHPLEAASAPGEPLFLFELVSALRYERPVEFRDAVLVFRVRTLKSRRRLVVFELRY